MMDDEYDCERLSKKLIDTELELQKSRAHVESLKAQLDMLQQVMMEDSEANQQLIVRERERRQEDRLSPLVSAIERGDVEVATQMLTSSNISQLLLDDALCVACRCGHLAIADILIRRGADIHHDCESPLLWACSEGRTAIAKLLISSGADVNVLKGFPLRIAYRNGASEIIQCLVDHGSRLQ